MRYVKARNRCYVAAGQLDKLRADELNAETENYEAEIRGTGKILHFRQRPNEVQEQNQNVFLVYFKEILL